MNEVDHSGKKERDVGTAAGDDGAYALRNRSRGPRRNSNDDARVPFSDTHHLRKRSTRNTSASFSCISSSFLSSSLRQKTTRILHHRSMKDNENALSSSSSSSSSIRRRKTSKIAIVCIISKLATSKDQSHSSFNEIVQTRATSIDTHGEEKAIT